MRKTPPQKAVCKAWPLPALHWGRHRGKDGQSPSDAVKSGEEQPWLGAEWSLLSPLLAAASSHLSSCLAESLEFFSYSLMSFRAVVSDFTVHTKLTETS